AGHPATVTLDVPTDRGRVSSRKYGRTAADALPKPRCGIRCLDEPKLEQDEGHQQDGDTGDIAPAPYWQFGRRGLTRRESCRHLRRIPREVVPALGTPINLPINVNILWLFRGCTRLFAWTCLGGVSSLRCGARLSSSST